jgi:adenylate cyclase class IV
VVDAAHDEAACRAQVDRILPAFGVAEGDCVRASYGDLLRA